ncbi:hypothetical protein EDD36DRAFT_469345 [Exophiala viscosa]|uniref:Uncharacterized protein n=1 Tax=Exophiala viscosa TaxID=2486360 RepID=A0AAN6DKU4_9EURO|nr:hypothetical protein EDD36DRAFT_469345 [Exophiala viscosa]
MANFNDRDARRFSLSPTVAVRVSNGQGQGVSTYHLPSSLLRKYTNMSNKQGEIDKFDIIAPLGVFSAFVAWLYRPEFIKTYQLRLRGEQYQQLWELARRLEVEELRNQMVDHVQSLPFDDSFISILVSFKPVGLGTTALVAYMWDKVVFEIADKGWAQFTQVAESLWEHIMRNPVSFAPLTKRLMEMLKDAHLAKTQGALEDPATTMNCKFHAHTEKSKLDCPRYQPEPPPKKAKMTIKPKVAAT